MKPVTDNARGAALLDVFIISSGEQRVRASC